MFSVTPEARWQYLNQRAKQPEIGKLIDSAVDLIEVDNPLQSRLHEVINDWMESLTELQTDFADR